MPEAAPPHPASGCQGEGGIQDQPLPSRSDKYLVVVVGGLTLGGKCQIWIFGDENLTLL
jgi:hypothetical protein